MRIHSLTIKNVRAVDYLKVDNLPGTGVIVIHGDNEQGKSTILDALNALLNYKHNSGAKDVKALAPVHRDERPEISAHLTIGPVEFRLTKRWLKSKGAELEILAPQHANFTGGDAEDKLAEIVAEHLDTTLLETLFLRQDDLGKAVKAAGIPSLEQALNAGAEGEVIDTSEDDALMAAVEREYLRFYTRTGAENKAVTSARKDSERAAAEFEAAQTKMNELDAHVDQVERHETSRASDEADLPDAREHLRRAQEEFAAAQKVEVEAASARESLDRARAELDGAQRAITERKELEAEANAAKHKAAEWAEQLKLAREKAQAEKDKVAELKAGVTAAKQARDEAAETAKAARATAQLVSDLAELSDLSRLVDQLDDIDANLARARATVAGLSLTDEDVAAAEDAARAVDVARGIRDLAIARLEVTSTAAEGSDIDVDGEKVSVGEDAVRVELHDGLRLGIGTISAVYYAGDGASSDPDADLRAAERVLADLLEAAGCETLGELKKLRDEAATARATVDSLQLRRTDLLGARQAEDVRARADHLATQLADTEHPALDQKEAKTAVLEAEARVEQADQDVRAAEAALEPWNGGVAEKHLVRVTADYDNAEARRLEFAEKLYKHQDRATLEQLETAVDSATTALGAAQEKAEKAEAALAVADPENKQAAAESAAARVESIESRIRTADVELARLSGYIDRAAGAAEDLEVAKSKAEVLSHRLAGLERQAQAAARLRDVLRRHRAAARARYAQPFVDELTRLARPVFGPDVSFELGENLTVNGRTLAGATIPLSALSGGAKEQLAILTRFAIASLITREGGNGATMPVVVDDALGSTDPKRLQLMGQLFSQLGRDCQVIVLTCYPQRYDWVHPKTEYPITRLKQG